jgi:mRNA-degrading endonuclease RelE of RelBE toxin-antitoxin system
MELHDKLHKEDLKLAVQALKEYTSGKVVFRDHSATVDYTLFKAPSLSSFEIDALELPLPSKARSIDYDYQPKWLIGMSNDFIKAVQDVDRKLKGRILDAIGYISKSPMVPNGDTVKPLRRPDRLWRYRIGDYRLIYLPIPHKRQILLVNFSSRGSAYS